MKWLNLLGMCVQMFCLCVYCNSSCALSEGRKSFTPPTSSQKVHLIFSETSLFEDKIVPTAHASLIQSLDSMFFTSSKSFLVAIWQLFADPRPSAKFKPVHILSSWPPLARFLEFLESWESSGCPYFQRIDRSSLHIVTSPLWNEMLQDDLERILESSGSEVLYLWSPHWIPYSLSLSWSLS